MSSRLQFRSRQARLRFEQKMMEAELPIFLSGVDKRGPDECWPWTRSRRGGRYGQATWRGAQCGTHRIAWEVHNAARVPDGMHVLHSCDNPPCCNPAHLRVGTPADNAADAADRGRTARGERARAKLTEAAVADIRRRRAAGELRVVLAAEYGISLAGMISLERGRTWAHVTDPPPGIFPHPPGQENRPHIYRKRKAAA